MKEEYPTGADTDDVVVKHTLIDDLGILLDEHRFTNAVQPGHGFGRFPGLPGGKSSWRRPVGPAVFDAEHEQVHQSIVGMQPSVVRRTFIAILVGCRQGIVMHEVVRIRKHMSKHRRGCGGFDRTMELGPKICRSEMNSAIRGIRRR